MIKILLRSVCFVVLGACVVAPAFAADDSSVSESYLERRMKSFEKGKQKTYSKVKSTAQSKEIKRETKIHKVVLQDALMIHNLMNSINAQINQLEAFRLAVLEKEISNAVLSDFDTCNENWLSGYFEKPQDVWKKLKEETEARILYFDMETAVDTQEMLKEDTSFLTGIGDKDEITEQVQRNAQGMLAQLEKEKAQKSGKKVEVTNLGNDEEEDDSLDMSQTVEENAPQIDITFAVLNKFYSRQDDWGKRKVGAGSLPLWEDQKYLYNKNVWEPKYQEIVKVCQAQKCKVPDNLKNGPKIEDKVKYDYYFHNNVVSAHEDYVAKLQSACLAAGRPCVLPNGVADAPEVAPRPLPPVEEEIVVIKNEDIKAKDGKPAVYSVYPINPMNPNPAEMEGEVVKIDDGLDTGFKKYFYGNTLWEAYKADGYGDVYKKGEFNTYFKVEGSKEEKTVFAKSAVDDIDGNRLSKYLLFQRNAVNATNAYIGFLNDAKELKANVNDMAEKVKITIPDDINYLKKDDLEKLLKTLKAKKEDLLKEAKKQIDSNKQIAEAQPLIEIEKTSDDVDVSSGEVVETKTFNEMNKGGSAKRAEELKEAGDVGKNVREETRGYSEAEPLTEKEKQEKRKKARKERSEDEDAAFYNAMTKDKKAELLITEDKALKFDEALKEARANQKLMDTFREYEEKSKLEDLKNKNYGSDAKKTCLRQNKNNTLIKSIKTFKVDYKQVERDMKKLEEE